MRLSARVRSIKPSSTLALSAKAKAMVKEGIDVVDFGVGEPDFDTPEHIKIEGIKAIERGETRYTPASGTKELKEAIVEKLLKDNGLQYKVSDIVVSNGAKHSLYNIFQAICDPGDEVIVPAPYWVSYPEQVRLAEAVPKVIETDMSTDFKISPAQLEEAITPKTKAVIINSPSNPTGSVYTPDELKAIAEVAVKKGILIVSDEIYEKLVYDGTKQVSIASFGEDVKEHTIVVNGVSKTYAMTGWRIGYAAGPSDIMSAISNLQSHATSNPASMAQAAAIAALKGSQESVEMMRREFERRRNYIVDRLNSIPGVQCRKPLGAFYVFPNVSALYGRKLGGKVLRNSQDLTAAMLEEAKIAIVDGGGFGADDYVRLSYATSMEKIEKGLDRFEAAVKKME